MIQSKLWEKIDKIKIDPDCEKTTLKTPGGNFEMAVEKINNPDCVAAVESFPAKATSKWSFYHHEVHYIMRGKAEVSYTLPPFHLEEKQMEVEPGDCYHIPQGAQLQWKVVSEEPLTKLCILMPNPLPPEMVGKL